LRLFLAMYFELLNIYKVKFGFCNKELKLSNKGSGKKSCLA